MERRIGIYSGTFDPVHPGHIAFAAEAMRACDLDEVVFLPERTPRNKQNVTGMLHRVALLKKVTKTMQNMSVVTLASDQFTVEETLPELRNIYSGAQLTLLIGSDVARTFPYHWQGMDVLLAEVSLAVGIRTGDNPDEITVLMGELEREYDVPIRYTCITAPEADLTSSQIRNGVVDSSRLHPAILDYVQDHR